MDKPKPKITQLKAPSKWDILKFKSKDIKEYLRGTIIKGTGVKAKNPVPTVTISKYDDGEFTKKYRKIRKKINRISYKSRRKNRSGI